MLSYLKYLIQLILSPARGWEDLAEREPAPESMLRLGLYPLLGIAAASELPALFYEQSTGLATVLMHAVVDFGAYFVSIFIARLLFDIYLGRLTETPDRRHTETLVAMGIGMMVIIRIIDNILPWDLVLMRFLPLYVMLVLYKSSQYMAIPANNEIRYLVLAASACVAVPMIIYYLLFVILP